MTENHSLQLIFLLLRYMQNRRKTKNVSNPIEWHIDNLFGNKSLWHVNLQQKKLNHMFILYFSSGMLINN